MIDSSVDAESFRIDKKAAIRMVSEPLDQRSRHFYGAKINYYAKLKMGGAVLSNKP